MGGKNLNLKKSWEPTLEKNQVRVYEAQQKALSKQKQEKEIT